MGLEVELHGSQFLVMHATAAPAGVSEWGVLRRVQRSQLEREWECMTCPSKLPYACCGLADAQALPRLLFAHNNVCRACE